MSARLRRVAAVALRQYYLMRGSPVRVVPVFSWVLIDIVLWGFIARYLQTVAAPGVNFTTALLGAVLVWDFFSRAMFGVTTAFFEDVWSRNFLNLFASPLSPTEYLAGLVATSVATGLAALAAMMLAAGAIFDLSYAALGAMFLPYVAVLFVFGVALGVCGVSLVLRFGPAAEWLIWPLPAVLAPFAGVFYPVAVLPAWMRGVAWALPPAHVFEGMRGLLAGEPPALGGLALAAGLAALYLLLAVRGFGLAHRRATRTGLIARYSAETTS